jgi:hypothetical protein
MSRLRGLFLAVLICGCASNGHRPLAERGALGADAAVVPDAPELVLVRSDGGLSGRLGFTYVNRTGRTISLLNCRGTFGHVLEKWDGAAWVKAWGPALLGCLDRPIVIGAGGAHRFTLDVWAGEPGTSSWPQFVVDPIEGDYRLVITAAYWSYDHDGPPFGEPPPLEHRSSSKFAVTVR